MNLHTPFLVNHRRFLKSDYAIPGVSAGLAAAFAHSHLISATGYEVSLSTDPVDLTRSHLEFQTRVQDLDIDNSDIVARVRPALVAMAIKDVFPVPKGPREN